MVDISICLPIIYILFSTLSNARGVLLGILGRVCCPVQALNPYPILGQKMLFFISVIRPGLLNSIPRSFLKEFMSSLLRLEQQQKNHSFGIETINTFIHSRSSLESHTRFQSKMDEIYTRFQTKTAQKPGLFGAAHTVYGICKEYPPPPHTHTHTPTHTHTHRTVTMQYSGRQGFRNLF